MFDPPGGEYAEGTEVTLTANPNTGYIFKEWSGDITGSENPVTITMDSDKNVSAEFENPNALTLAITSENGTVQATPAQESYRRGASVILVATPDDGYKFVGWEGDLSGSSNPVGFVMDGSKNITAVFSEIANSSDLFAEQKSQIEIYPNPFSTETTISYQLSHPSPVRISIHNLQGQKISVLFDGRQAAGVHQVNWDGKQTDGKPLPPGMYICRFKTSSGVIQTVKMILTK